MYTETELRDALAHSAARAEDDRAAPGGTVPTATGTPRRRVLLPLAAAAAVVAVAAVGLIATRPDGDGSAPAAGPDVSRDATALDLFHIGTPGTGAETYLLAHEAHGYRWTTASVQTGAVDSPTVDVVPAGQPFDATAIPRDHPVRIGGRTGYYGYFDLNPGADRDESSPKYRVAFRNDRGDWVFAALDHNPPNRGYTKPRDRSVPDPARIVAAYERLDVSFGPGENRVAFRPGWLPEGVTLARIGDTFAAREGGGYGDMLLWDGNRTVEILRDAPSGYCEVYARGKGVTVCVRGYPQATAERVLDELTVRPASADPHDYFTIRQAFSQG